MWTMRVPSGERLYRSRGMLVTIVLCSDLTVFVYGPGSLSTIGTGEVVMGSPAFEWERSPRGRDRLCPTARDMIAECVLCVVRAHRYTSLPNPLSLNWFERSKRGVARVA
jgi:hypothetical protein